MFSMFDETITIYNYSKSGTAEKWFRSELARCCQWNETQEKTITSDRKIQIAQSVDVCIVTKKLLKPFKPLKEWNKQTDAQKKDTWTIDHISNKDIIVLGTCEKEVTSAYTITDIKKDYQDVMTVSSFMDNTKLRGLPNYRLGGK